MPHDTPYLVHTTLARTPPADAWRPDLPPAWGKRLAAMRSVTARRRTLAGLWLLREAAALAGRPRLALDRLTRDVHGRPALPDGPAFNISHCGPYVACAVTCHTPVGLDLERIRPIDARRFARFLSDAENAAVARDPAAFFIAWTAREAAVKAGGRVGLARIARVRVVGDDARLDGERLHLQWPVLGDGLVACLAAAQPLAPAVVRQLPAPDL